MIVRALDHIFMCRHKSSGAAFQKLLGIGACGLVALAIGQRVAIAQTPDTQARKRMERQTRSTTTAPAPATPLA